MMINWAAGRAPMPTRLPQPANVSSLTSLPEYFNKMQQQQLANQRQAEAMEMRKAQMAQANAFRDKQFQAGRSDAAASQDFRNRQLELQTKRLEQAGQAGPTTYGKTAQVFKGPDGNFYSAQASSDGRVLVRPLQYKGQDGQPAKPLTPAKGTGTVDTATGTQIIDKGTGAPIRNVAKNLAEAERSANLCTKIPC